MGVARILFLAFMLWAPSVQAEKVPYGLVVGEKAPAIDAVDIEGNPFILSEALKEGPVVLVFYRGGWCMFCNLQLQSMQKEVVPVATQIGAKIVAISVDRIEEAAKSQKEHQLDMTILSDANVDIVRDYRLKYQVSDELVEKYKREYNIDIEKASGRKHHILPVPAVFIINKNGFIIYEFADVDYKKRAPNEEIIMTLKELA